MSILKVAEVAVEGMPSNTKSIYDYIIPQTLSKKAVRGVRVIVPFGRGNRKRRGIILEIKVKSDIYKLKSIYSVIDLSPVLSEEMILLVKWLSEKTLSSVYDCVHTVLPAGMGLVLKKQLCVNTDRLNKESLDEDSQKITEYIINNENLVYYDKILNDLGDKCENLINRLINEDIIDEKYDTKRKVGDATVKMVELNLPSEDVKLYIERYKLSNPKHIPVLEFLLETSEISESELCYMTGVSVAVLKTLEKRGIINFYYEEVFRNPYSLDMQRDNSPLELSESQRDVSDRIYNEMQQGYSVSLLYGITGSGKTHIFFDLIDKVIAHKKGVILMVPEISLATQMIHRMISRYGDIVAIMHSGLSLGERLDEWKRIKRGKALIAIGTRSAVFAPFKSLGLVIIDEEQEHTYKSENSPKFHARNVAIFRCKYHKALLLLSSATPSIESYYFATENKYSFFTLEERFNKMALPRIIVADMKEELCKGNKSIFSSVLANEIDLNLKNGEQSILFINRRGYNTFVSCRSCGYVVKCPNCSISLTYHSKNNRLMCHYCGYSKPSPIICPECSSEHIRYFGTGTQKVEAELCSMFPDIRVMRMDADTTTRKFSHENMLSKFSKGEYDVLLGTQMVTKGLDFENVTLVGVLAADLSLYADDFRANERTFSLITQVTGRAGRGEKKGRAVIQTYTTDSSVLSLAYSGDYKGFYKEEIMLRKALIYPPFCDICQVIFSSDTAKSSMEAATKYKELLLSNILNYYPDISVSGIGPSPCQIVRVNNKYRYKLLLKCKANKRFRDIVREINSLVSKDKILRNISISVDFNPFNIL